MTRSLFTQEGMYYSQDRSLGILNYILYMYICVYIILYQFECLLFAIFSKLIFAASYFITKIGVWCLTPLSTPFQLYRGGTSLRYMCA